MRFANKDLSSPIIAPLRDTGLAGLAGPGPGGGPPGGPEPGGGGALLGGGPGGPGGPGGTPAAAPGVETAGAPPERVLSAEISLFTAFN